MTRLASRAFYARRDTTEAQIIAELEAQGWHVWRKLPVDLLLWRHGDGFRTLECKSIGKPLVPKKGPQEAFIALTGTQIVNKAQDFKA
jgi:hypothetical protein